MAGSLTKSLTDNQNVSVKWEVYNIPLPPGPYPNKRKRKLMESPQSSRNVNEKCCELPESLRKLQTPIINNKCYELASFDLSSQQWISSKRNETLKEGNERCNISFSIQSDISPALIKHRKALSALRYRGNNISLLSEATQEKKSPQDSNARSTPVYKPTYDNLVKQTTPLPVKRSHSTMSDDTTSQANQTPKRNLERFWIPDSPQNSPLSYHCRKSFPGTIEVDAQKSSSDSNIQRRKSFPFSNLLNQSPSLVQSRCTTDQTPYAVQDSYPLRKRMRPALPYYNAFDLITTKYKAGFIDSHCHLDFLFQRQGYSGTYADFQKKHQDTYPVSYAGCLAVFCNPFTFKQVYKWKPYIEEENVYASFGCHPHNAKDYNDDVEKSLFVALQHSKVRALGEIGLDYSNRNNCLKEQQFAVFKRQLKLALTKQLPVVVHCRDAHEDGMNIIKEILPHDYTIHLHCFTDKWEWAQKWLQEFPNLFIGLTNVVTFPSAESVHEVARNIPLDRLLLETDAPYFVPRMVTKGTKFSHPGMAIHVAAQIAVLRSISIDEVLYWTRKNTKAVYNIE